MPPQILEAMYDKDNHPMVVGSIYPNMLVFKVALTSQAIKHEFEYDIKKSDPRKHMVHYIERNEGCSG